MEDIWGIGEDVSRTTEGHSDNLKWDYPVCKGTLTPVSPKVETGSLNEVVFLLVFSDYGAIYLPTNPGVFGVQWLSSNKARSSILENTQDIYGKCETHFSYYEKKVICW